MPRACEPSWRRCVSEASSWSSWFTEGTFGEGSKSGTGSEFCNRLFSTGSFSGSLGVLSVLRAGEGNSWTVNAGDVI